MKLFISYAHVDKSIVKEWIVDKLISGGHAVWFDDRISTGSDWKQTLDDEIQRCDALVFAMTPESVKSKWCLWELDKAIECRKGIIPVLLQSNTKVPKQLLSIQYVDFSNGATGDAVARLMGGIQRISPSQPQDLSTMQVKPFSRVLKILRDSAFASVLGIVAIIITLILANQPVSPSSPTPTNYPTETINVTSTVLTIAPVIIALRDVEIKSGPGPDFELLYLLYANQSLDVLGISQDRLWYLVLLPEGRSGWVLASTSGVRLDGNPAILRVMIPTLTPTHTHTYTNTPMPSNTVILTNTPTNTVSPTLTHTALSPTSTLTPTISATFTAVPPTPTITQPTATPQPTSTPVQAQTGTLQYPCDAQIIVTGSSGLLYIIYPRASDNSTPFTSVQPGSAVIILADRLVNGRKWYQIAFGNPQDTGWTWDSYVQPSQNCP